MKTWLAYFNSDGIIAPLAPSKRYERWAQETTPYLLPLSTRSPRWYLANVEWAGTNITYVDVTKFM